MGDANALRQLHRALVPVMIAFFRRAGVGAASSAEELANQSVAEAFQALTEGRYDSSQASFTTFLYGVAYKIRLRQRRKRATSREVVFSELMSARSEAMTDRAVDESEQVLALDEICAMRTCLFAEGGPLDLSPEERFVMIGRANGATFQVLADQLGRSLDTVYRLNLRALNKLRENMRNRGVYASPPKND